MKGSQAGVLGLRTNTEKNHRTLSREEEEEDEDVDEGEDEEEDIEEPEEEEEEDEEMEASLASMGKEGPWCVKRHCTRPCSLDLVTMTSHRHKRQTETVTYFTFNQK